MSSRLPLVLKAHQRELEGMEAERTVLAKRLKELPLNSSCRPKLQARLAMLTLHALKTENERAR